MTTLLILLLDKVLDVDVVRLEVLDHCEAALLLDARDRTHISALGLWNRVLTLKLKNWTVDCLWKCVEGCWVRHAKLQSFLYSCFNRIIVTESLPLSIYWIHASPWKVALLNKSLPVYLVLVLLARELLCDLEDLDQFPHREPCSLTWQPRLLLNPTRWSSVMWQNLRVWNVDKHKVFCWK